MTCPFCEKEIKEGAKFCEHCGKDVSVDENVIKEAEERLKKEETTTAEDSLAEINATLGRLAEKLEKPVTEKPQIVAGADPLDKDPSCGFGKSYDGFAKYLLAVRAAGFGMGLDKRLIPLQGTWTPDEKTMTVAAGTGGGFLVPTEFRPLLVERALEAAVIRPRATVITDIQGDSIDFPTITDTSHASSVHGGVIGYWTAEAATKDATQPTIGQATWRARELVCYTEVSDKLIKFSALGIGQLLAQKLGSAIAWFEDDSFINGTGAGQPLGILTSGALIQVTKKAGQAAATIVAENISSMLSRIRPEAENDAVWIAHPLARQQLLNLNLAVGTGGGLVFMPDFKGKPQWVLFGLPIIFSEKCSALGTAGDIILADLRQYWIADFGEMEIAASPHVKFNYNITCWRVVKYVDGQPSVNTTLTLKDGTSTVSDYVAIAVRA